MGRRPRGWNEPVVGTLVVLLILGAGCSSRGTPQAGEDPGSSSPEPTSTRTSTGGPYTPDEAEEGIEYNLTSIETFNLDLPDMPNDAISSHTTAIAASPGNGSVLQIEATFYQNGLTLVNSVYGQGAFDTPALVGKWADGTAFVDFSLDTGTFRWSPGPAYYVWQSFSGYQEAKGAYPANLEFSTRGWGDMYVEVSLAWATPVPLNATAASG